MIPQTLRFSGQDIFKNESYRCAAATSNDENRSILQFGESRFAKMATRAGNSASRGLFENVETNMERSVAIKKLTKLLGKSLGYRVDPKAPDQNDRDDARAALKLVGAERDALDKQVAARRLELLQADLEYQRLKAAYADAKKRSDELLSISSRYRFTAGVMTSMFFMVKAQGDSWEEVIAKVEKERVAA